jgi:allophycocyanin alpha subunit
MSVVTKSIVNADAEARYLSPGELDRIKGFVSSGERRLRIAQTLTESRDYYLRLVTYGVVSGDVTPIEEIGLVGVKEMYNSLGTPIPGVVEGVRGLKNAAASLLSGEDAAEAGYYFDYVIGAMQ